MGAGYWVGGGVAAVTDESVKRAIRQLKQHGLTPGHDPYNHFGMFVYPQTNSELLQIEWSSFSSEQERREADEELTRRGVQYRYC